MKYVITIMIVFLVFLSYFSKEKPEDYYHNINLKIISITNKNSLFHRVKSSDIYKTCTTVLFKQLDINLYYQFNSCDCCGNPVILITPEWLHIHKPGDIITIEKVYKNDFFKMYN